MGDAGPRLGNKSAGIVTVNRLLQPPGPQIGAAEKGQFQSWLRRGMGRQTARRSIRRLGALDLDLHEQSGRPLRDPLAAAQGHAQLRALVDVGHAGGFDLAGHSGDQPGRRRLPLGAQGAPIAIQQLVGVDPQAPHLMGYMVAHVGKTAILCADQISAVAADHIGIGEALGLDQRGRQLNRDHSRPPLVPHHPLQSALLPTPPDWPRYLSSASGQLG